MTAVAFWHRKEVQESQERSQRIRREATVREKRFRDTTERLESAANRAERAAIVLVTRHDDLLRLAARRP